MHELAIAQSLVEAVEAKALECNATRVKDVHLKIGETLIIPSNLSDLAGLVSAATTVFKAQEK